MARMVMKSMCPSDFVIIHSMPVACDSIRRGQLFDCLQGAWTARRLDQSAINTRGPKVYR